MPDEEDESTITLRQEVVNELRKVWDEEHADMYEHKEELNDGNKN